MSVFLIFYYSIFSLFCFFLSLYCIYYVYCYGRPALMDVCLHWQPANILIVVYLFNLFIWLLNSLSLEQLDPRQQLANTPPPQSTTPGLHPVSIHQMAPPKRTSDCSFLLIYRPRKDERLSWPSWLTCSGRFTHIVITRQLQAECRTGSVRRPRTGVLPTVLHNQLCHTSVTPKRFEISKYFLHRTIYSDVSNFLAPDSFK